MEYINIYKEFVAGRLDAFYRDMYAGLLRYAARLLGDELSYLAEDCVQDGIMATYLNRSTLTSEKQWRAWLLTSIRNRAIEIIRKANSKATYAQNIENQDSASTESSSVEADLIEQETLDLFFSAIADLPDRYREIVELSFEQGLKNEEVAKLLSITEVAVRKRKRRLIEILREKLGGRTSEEYVVALLSSGLLSMMAE